MDPETMERVANEEREWLVARLHHATHGNWLGPEECPYCLGESEKAAEA